MTKVLEGPEVERSWDYAYNKVYVSETRGDGRNYRSRHTRSLLGEFINNFYGKLAEFVLYKELVDRGYDCTEPNLELFAPGIGDGEVDMVCEGSIICCKSTKLFNKYLLLETYRYNEDIKVDFFVINRIEYMRLNDFREYKEKVYGYKTPKVLTLEEFQQAVRDKDFWKADHLLGKEPLEVDNYHFEIEGLHNLEVIPKLRKLKG